MEERTIEERAFAVSAPGDFEFHSGICSQVPMFAILFNKERI